MRSSVLLPQPEGPTTVTNSPARTSKLTGSRACVPSGKVIDTPRKLSAAATESVIRGTVVGETDVAMFILFSVHDHPAGDVERLAGAVLRVVGGEEDGHTGDVFRGAQPAERGLRRPGID